MCREQSGGYDPYETYRVMAGMFSPFTQPQESIALAHIAAFLAADSLL